MEIKIIWLIKLLLAHFISDFALQPNSWIIQRRRLGIKSKELYYHVALTSIIAFVLIGTDYPKTLLVITVTHWFIDWMKTRFAESFRLFLIDQVLHIIIIIICWIFTFNLFPTKESLLLFYEYDQFWIYFAGFFFLTLPSSIIIGAATKQWNVQYGLMNAGKYIGIIERIMICYLVYESQYEAIGLLITGKSILRFKTSDEETKTEYLLVGTFLSLFLAFAIGLFLKIVTNIS